MTNSSDAALWCDMDLFPHILDIDSKLKLDHPLATFLTKEMIDIRLLAEVWVPRH